MTPTLIPVTTIPTQHNDSQPHDTSLSDEEKQCIIQPNHKKELGKSKDYIEDELTDGQTIPKDDEDLDEYDPEQTHHFNVENQDYQRPAKLDLFVGFLRLFSFISVCTSVFSAITSSLFLIQEKQNDHPNTLYPTSNFLFYLRSIAGIIQLAYLFVNSVFVIIDSIATMTFRWKEYGELTHRHTDATSIMFLVSKSRWKQRFLEGLTVCSATSVQSVKFILHYYGHGPGGDVHKDIPNMAVHAVIWYLTIMSTCLVSVVIGYLLYLMPAHLRDTPWLENYQTDHHIDDNDDRWKSLNTHCRSLSEKKENRGGFCFFF